MSNRNEKVKKKLWIRHQHSLNFHFHFYIPSVHSGNAQAPCQGRDVQHLQHMTESELNAPRKLRERRRVIQANVSKAFQDTVFSIPELRTTITSFLSVAEIRALVCVCHAWNKFWIPSLYQLIHVTSYKRTRVYPKVRKFGHYVQALQVVNTKIHGALHLIDHMPHLRRLILGQILVSGVKAEEILRNPTAFARASACGLLLQSNAQVCH